MALAVPTIPRLSAFSASPTHVSNRSSSSISIATVAFTIASHVLRLPWLSHFSASFSHWSLVSKTWCFRNSRTPSSIVRSTISSSLVFCSSVLISGACGEMASCSSKRPAAIQISWLVGTAFRALLRTAFARSGVSRRASASQSSTDMGMTSTARARRILASAADSSRLTVSFQSRTEFGMCSRAVERKCGG